MRSSSASCWLFVLGIVSSSCWVMPPNGEIVMRKKVPVIFAGECDRLKKIVAGSSVGQDFLLVADTNNTCTPNNIRDDLRTLLQMSFVIHFRGGVQVSQIDTGRLSLDRDTDVIQAHNELVQSMNLVRAFLQGGYSDLYNVKDWFNDDDLLQQCLQFIGHRRIDNYFTGHPSRCLAYEKALCRVDSITMDNYACSSHLLWVEHKCPERRSTIAMLKQVKNPVGIEVLSSHSTDLRRLEREIRCLNPHNDVGRIVLLTQGTTGLAQTIRHIQGNGLNVAWCADMRSCSKKEDIVNVLQLHENLGSWTGLRVAPSVETAYTIAECISNRRKKKVVN